MEHIYHLQLVIDPDSDPYLNPLPYPMWFCKELSIFRWLIDCNFQPRKVTSVHTDLEVENV